MDDRTLEALKGSIAKWKAIIAGTGEDHGCENCPLCLLFHPDYAPDDGQATCEGCPVRARTGSAYCKDTPYEDWDGSDDDKEVAREELDFLISLLPADDPDRAQALSPHQVDPAA